MARLNTYKVKFEPLTVAARDEESAMQGAESFLKENKLCPKAYTAELDDEDIYHESGTDDSQEYDDDDDYDPDEDSYAEDGEVMEWSETFSIQGQDGNNMSLKNFNDFVDRRHNNKVRN